ncbi:MAG: heme-binding domain-containing protein [Lewinellaceae bacterium]|nr:heme-binding domain-containing protein [Lewinellaceae bacterium]
MRKKILLALLGLALAIQLIRPDTSVPAVDPAQDFIQVLQPPAEIATILKTACYDCHSYTTRYPWYNQIAPVSWWLANHIREGREHLNFSTFAALPPGDRAEVLEEAIEEIKKGKMPLDSYTWTHTDARLSAEQKNVLVAWLNTAGGQH